MSRRQTKAEPLRPKKKTDKAQRKPPEHTRAGRSLKWLAAVTVSALIIPIVQVGCVRVVNPPATPLMWLRPLEARLQGHAPRPSVYYWINRSDMPRQFLRCVLTAEDQRFFEHRGFDWREMRNAQRQAERSGRALRGASTVSMQCARSLFLWQGRSWIRKGLEAYYTFWMETLLPKQRILELYANVIEMGDGVYGVEAAAQTHFGVSARQLGREQCALLAAILPNPRHWNPRQPTPRLSARSERILTRESTTTFPQLR